MEREHDDRRKVADYVPLSAIRSPRYRLAIATYPCARFIDPRASLRDRYVPRSSVAVDKPARASEDEALTVRARCFVAALLVLATACAIPLLLHL